MDIKVRTTIAPSQVRRLLEAPLFLEEHFPIIALLGSDSASGGLISTREVSSAYIPEGVMQPEVSRLRREDWAPNNDRLPVPPTAEVRAPRSAS